jgi:hypothetical protein
MVLTGVNTRAADCGLLGVEARMPWNADYYPVSMKNLSPHVRAKAIEIANALLESGRPEGQAIRIGIARAKQWAARATAARGARAPFS